MFHEIDFRPTVGDVQTSSRRVLRSLPAQRGNRSEGHEIRRNTGGADSSQ